MIDRIYKNHNGFSLVLNYLLTYALLQVTAYLALATAYFRGNVPTIAVPFLFILILLNPVMGFAAANAVPRNAHINLVLLSALGLTAYVESPLVPVGSLLMAFALTYTFRKLGWTRVPFNDLKNKRDPKYQQFFERYCAAVKQAFLERESRRT